MSIFRNVCFTLNNYTDEEVDKIKKIECRYIVFGYEKGENGTPHLQGYIEFEKQVRFNKLKDLLGRSHFEKRRGTPTEASDYCKKDGNYYENGTISKQGKRTDLIELKNSIIDGKSINEIVLEDPVAFHQYGRTLCKIEDIRFLSKSRSDMPSAVWYWGPTGVGKSHMAFKDFTPDTHYVYPNDNGWWDGYKQQDTVIINDFRGEIPYNQLLQMIDKWPFSVKRRNREPIPFISKNIIITSSLKPDQVYHNRNNEDNIAQLLRRLTVTEVVRG